MGPSKGRDVGQEFGLDRQAGVVSLSDRFAEMGRIPVNDDDGELFSVSRPMSIAHSTGLIPLSVRSCPLPESTRESPSEN